MKYLIVLYFLFSISSAVHAQNIYLVYKIYGKAFYNSPKGKVKVIIGNTYNESDSIFLEAKSKITFLCNNYVPFVVEKEGIVDFKKIAVNCLNSNQNNSITFFKFVWQQFSHPHEDPIKHRKKYFNNLGAPIRGDVSIEKYYDSFFVVERSTVKLKWELKSAQPQYLYIWDSGNDSELIYSSKPIITEEFDLVCDSSNHIFPGVYKWQIGNEWNQENKSQQIFIISKTKFDSLHNKIQNQIPTTYDESERNMFLGFEFEKKHFYLEALRCYNKALKINPDNQIYKQLLTSFNKAYQF